MFTNATNTQIHGNPLFIYNDHRNDASAELLKDGMRLLLSRVVKGAMHNSGERFDGPSCHPETRIALQDDILGWADEVVVDLNEIVTWLYGPAGAGKSAIAQTIAEKLQDRDQLTASFFFSRASGGEGRGAETDLIATLAYQLSQSVPATQPYIATTVGKNPVVFDLALQDQVNLLIVAPLLAISGTASGDEETSSSNEKPRIIVIDGLDECRKEKDAQRRVANALISGLRQIPHHTHKLFITSRPEHYIASIFNKYEAKILRKMELNDQWNPDDDIRTFLLAGFADIRRSHFYFQNHLAEKTWPSLDDVRTLVRRSSGQFIYPSVVLKYIKSEENYNPIARLETILNLENTADQPYAELDALYHYILSQIQDVENVLHILSLERLCRSHHVQVAIGTGESFDFISGFLGLDESSLRFRLRPLSSLLSVSENTDILYKHASLPDFLLDKTRSGDFYINSLTIAVAMVSRAVKLFGGTSFMIFDAGYPVINVPRYYTQLLPHDQKFHVWTLLSNFNILQSLLCNWREINSDSCSHLFVVFTDYINWVVEESQNSSCYLSQPVAQIQTWITNHLELMNVNYFESPRIDPWPLFVGFMQTSTSGTMFDEDLATVLEILEHPHPWGFEFKQAHRHQMKLLWLFMRKSDWLDRTDLLGHYAMTTERYGVALQRTAYYLLKSPQSMLVDILQGYSRMDGVQLMRSVIPNLLTNAPETTDIYFLVALLFPVMDALDEVFGTPAAYIQRTVRKFPFLTDPMSVLYIQASTKLKDMLVNLGVKSYLHKVAERKQCTWFFESSLPYRGLLETFTAIDIRASELYNSEEELYDSEEEPYDSEGEL